MGSYTPQLLAPLGIGLPVYPIKGYSLTVPITDAAVAPVSTVMDETYKVATTRFADRIRVGGTAEIAGWDMTLRPHRRGPLERSLRDLFPEAGDSRKASFWCGLRPMTPDGTPVIGPTRNSPICFSIPATARWAGPWRPGRGRCWPISSRAGPPTSTPPISASAATRPEHGGAAALRRRRAASRVTPCVVFAQWLGRWISSSAAKSVATECSIQ